VITGKRAPHLSSKASTARSAGGLEQAAFSADAAVLLAGVPLAGLAS
jgi:hypothetical protein